MHLLSCKNPQRIYNKYSNEFVWVPCGKCSICKNRRSAHYTELLERERSQHKYCFFVTLTYSDNCLPVLSTGDFCEYDSRLDCEFVSSRSRDGICIPYNGLFPSDKFWKNSDDSCPDDMYSQADIDFFNSWIDFGGLPIVSKSDVQLFLKRLNKFIHDHVTHQFKNFRYFGVSEYGSTTFRGHYHFIFYCDNTELANRFSECVSSCWKFGISDCQLVENSACGYVAQYINKSADMPYVYKHKLLRPFFLCSRNPFIGTFTQCPEIDREIVDNSVVSTFVREKKDSPSFVNVPLQQSYQNKLFPKCPSYCTVSDNVRTQLYSISSRFPAKDLRSFITQIYDYLVSDSTGEFAEYLRFKLSFSRNFFNWSDPLHWFDRTSFNWIRRLFYFGRKVACQARQFGLSIYGYTKRIFQYYSNKELYLLRQQYEYQQEVCKTDTECIALMYPEYLFNNGFVISDYMHDLECVIPLNQIKDADYLYFSNKKTHFKNAYFDSLQFKRDSIFLFNILKTYFYAKKCNEVIEAFAT